MPTPAAPAMPTPAPMPTPVVPGTYRTVHTNDRGQDRRMIVAMDGAVPVLYLEPIFCLKDPRRKGRYNVLTHS
jgi:hypothetical protein